MSILAAFAAIAVLGILIVVHELGHFAAARFQRIHVNRFSIGFGPVLVKYQGSSTEYAIRAFPLGGYVGFPDDDPESDIPRDDPNLLRNRPLLDRAIVISAGVIANLVFAYFVLVAQAGITGVQEVNYRPGVVIPEIMSETTSAAFQAGIKAGDIVLAVDGQPLAASEASTQQLTQIIQSSPNQPLTFTLQRGEERLGLVVTPQLNDAGQGKIGVMLRANGENVLRRADNLFAALALGAQEYEQMTRLTAQGFVQLITHFKENARQVAGPVAIVAVGATLAQNDWGNLFQFGALISINLAIINILPLPALDGGQLTFLLLEGLRGRPLPLRLQENIMQTGLLLLLGLGVFLIVRDTVNLADLQERLQ